MNTRVRTTVVVHSHMNKWHPNKTGVVQDVTFATGAKP